MTPVYEVKTKHTKETLRDFLIFRERARNTNINFRFGMLTICCLTLAFIGREEPVLIGISLGLAVLLGGFALIRRPLGVHQLAKADVAYQKQSELHFVFGESEFRLTDGTTGETSHIKYGEVTLMYSDEKYYYINVNNDDLHMLPKSDFVLGNAEAFYDFFMNKTGKDFLAVKLPWKVKLGVMKQALIQTREENDAKNKAALEEDLKRRRERREQIKEKFKKKK